uniref:Uncharacterized protein n=1 Tax=Cacopsylla melanoneura TaxID=428564 RepID=A0A8D8PPV0_9HEMI
MGMGVSLMSILSEDRFGIKDFLCFFADSRPLFSSVLILPSLFFSPSSLGPYYPFISSNLRVFSFESGGCYFLNSGSLFVFYTFRCIPLKTSFTMVSCLRFSNIQSNIVAYSTQQRNSVVMM